MGLGLEPERDLLDLDRERKRGDLDLECQRSLEYDRLLDRDLDLDLGRLINGLFVL